MNAATDLLELSLCEAARLVKARSVSPLELVDAAPLRTAGDQLLAGHRDLPALRNPVQGDFFIK